MCLIALALGGTFLWDRLCTWLFSPRIFGAMMESARSTSIKDVVPIAATFGKVFGGLLLLASGNVFIWGGAAYWWYKRKQARQKALLEGA
jgi:hypothetical protein